MFIYFTCLSRSPHWTDFYKMWGVSPRYDLIFPILYQWLKGFWFCVGSNFTVFHTTVWSP